MKRFVAVNVKPLIKDVQHKNQHAEENHAVKNLHFLIGEDKFKVIADCSIEAQEVLLKAREVIPTKFKARRQKIINHAIIKQEIAASD